MSLFNENVRLLGAMLSPSDPSVAVEALLGISTNTFGKPKALIVNLMCSLTANNY